MEHGRAKLRALLPRLTHDSICVGDAGAVGVDRLDNFKPNTHTHTYLYTRYTVLQPGVEYTGAAGLCVLCV